MVNKGWRGESRRHSKVQKKGRSAVKKSNNIFALFQKYGFKRKDFRKLPKDTIEDEIVSKFEADVYKKFFDVENLYNVNTEEYDVEEFVDNIDKLTEKSKLIFKKKGNGESVEIYQTNGKKFALYHVFGFRSLVMDGRF